MSQREGTMRHARARFEIKGAFIEAGPNTSVLPKHKLTPLKALTTSEESNLFNFSTQ